MKTLRSTFAPLFAVLILTFAFTAFAPASANAAACVIQGYVYGYDNSSQVYIGLPNVLVTLGGAPGQSVVEVYTDYNGFYQTFYPITPKLETTTVFPYHDNYSFDPFQRIRVPCYANQVTYVDPFIGTPQ